MRTTISILLLSTLLLGACSNRTQEQISIASGELDVHFIAQRDTFNLVAVSAAIVKESTVVWAGTYGLRNTETDEATKPSTLFHQGSLSKTVTLAAFLHLWDSKGFGLDENINAYLPFTVANPNHKSDPISFRMLLTHTSSLNDVNVSERNNKMAALYGNSDSPAELGATLRSILDKDGELFDTSNFLPGKPGTEYAYSNVAYSLLGYLIERISGIAFTEYCNQRIFEPLQMNTSTYLLSKTDTSNFAFQYYSSPDDPENLTRIQPYTWPGYMDGSLRTSALEYSNFLIMLINRGDFKGNEILSEKVVDTMLAIQDLPGSQSARMFQPDGRALVWNRVTVGDHTIYHFNGFGGGFFTEAYFDPSAEIAGLFFTTGGFSSFEELVRFTEGTVLKMIDCSGGL